MLHFKFTIITLSAIVITILTVAIILTIRENIMEKVEIKRKEDYDNLVVKFKHKKGRVLSWQIKNYGRYPSCRASINYNNRVEKFFHYFDFSCPGGEHFIGYNGCDYTPLEKLTELYNKIEEEFPEPFAIEIRQGKIDSILNED